MKKHLNPFINTVLAGDCLEVMQSIPNNSIGLIYSVALLMKAKAVKRSKKVILIQTQANDLLDEIFSEEGLTIIQIPAIQFKRFL